MRVEDGKKAYESMEIPEELSGTVNGLIEADMRKRKGKTLRFLYRRGAAAAACAVLFAVGLNTNAAFAQTASEIPVIGALARVLTIRSFQETEGDYQMNVEVPAVEAEKGEAFADRVNAEIEAIVDRYTAQAKEEFEAYKEAFFATGGTEEEWNGRQMDIVVDYEVCYQQDPVLSLELVTAKGWVAASEERHYYNLDLEKEKELTLADVLGDDWISICNAEIDRQIREQIAADPGLSYFGYGDNDLAELKFRTVDGETDFYLNAAGEAVVVFPEYAIAPGYMGYREFVIGKQG